VTTSPTGTVQPGLGGLRRADLPGLEALPLDADGAGLEVDVRDLEAEQLTYSQA
jgi:hypothetical protein